jgi:hypothetical protein
MKKPRHSWKEIVELFRTSICTICDATKKWDSNFQRIVYYDGRGVGPFYKTPPCKSKCATNGN